MRTIPTILTICGSSRSGSKTEQFILFLAKEYSDKAKWSHFNQLNDLPLFDPDIVRLKDHELFSQLADQISQAQLVLMVTPEYLHSIPSQLKSLLEWSNADSLFASKKVVSIVYTPAAPRGQYAQKHLDQVLKALNVNHLLSCLLHHEKEDENKAHQVMEVVLSELS